MSDEGQLSISELRKRRAQATGADTALMRAPTAREEPGETSFIESSARQARPAGFQQRRTRTAPEPETAAFDRSRFVEALRRRWLWLVLAVCFAASVGGAIGFYRAKYTVLVTLTLRDLSFRFAGQEGTSYRPPQLSPQAMINFLTSPELLSSVSAQSHPPISERRLLKDLEVEQEKNSETVTVTITGRDPQALLDLANLYTAMAVERSRDVQREDPDHMYTNFTRLLQDVEQQQGKLSQSLTALRTNSGVVDPALENSALEKEWIDLRVKADMARGELALLDKKGAVLQNDPLQKRLQDAISQLIVYQSQGKTDQHPDVIRLRDEIAEINRQLSDPQPGANSLFAPQIAAADAAKKTLGAQIEQLESQAMAVKAKLDKLYENSGEYTRLKTDSDRLETYKRTLSSRQFEARQYRDNAEGYFKPPTATLAMKDIDTRVRTEQTAGAAGRGGLVGLLLSMGLVMLLEYADPRLKTAADVKRVTQLPVLATLGDLDKMDEAARKAWAFRTWTILSGSLNGSANSGAVCGFISCAHGEGRSTWVELLVDAARQRGLHVTKLDFGNSPSGEEASQQKMPDNESHAESNPDADAAPFASTTSSRTELLVREKNQPVSKVTSPSVIHVKLPGLVWDLERRIQFQNELDQWRADSRAVVLVDLPPASMPEAILLAESLPQLIWLADSGRSHMRETRLHLETLRHARCKLVGAVLNHEPEPLIKL